MNCASCGRTNRASARFCGGCGGSLAPRCPACGAAGEPDARFCDACGASFSPRAPEDGVARKVVTILFADLIGSTALHERLDPESVSRLMEGYHGAVRAPVEAHGGSVVQLLGDGVMCAFGVPRVAEDDALRAVRAAVDVQRAFRDFAREQGERVGPLGLRVALNTGEVVVSDDYSAGIGDPLNVAARLQQEARDGDVLIGEATQRLVAEQVTLARVGTFALKGRAEPVTAYRVESLERPAGAAAVPFVGRDDELRRLAVVYEGAVSAPGTRLAVLLGSPGLGKSRLLGEFARRLGESATVLTAACNAGGGATFAPLAEALRTALEAAVLEDDAERARVTGGIEALLTGAPASSEETFFVVRRLFAALASAQPLVLAIDDLHWAEPLLLDLVEHLVQWGAGVPVLVLAAARPELRDTRSSLASAGGVVSDVVMLGGLDAGAATRLAASVIGADALPAAVAGRVLATSEGNPLFLGELVRMLVNDGALRREGDRWTTAVELADLAMPPTIQALLAARIERLRPEERLVLERAAVVGRQFSRAAVVHLLPVEARPELDSRLEALRRSELIESDTGWLLGEPTLRFHHVLIRDAAYRRVLRNTRAELHARFAEWLEARAGESLEHDETIGWHLEQAHQHLRELGPLDAKGRALGESAAQRLAAAGRRALARDDLRPAASLLGRALDRLDPADAARAELALDWCEALLAAGEVGPAALAIGELGRFTAGSERLRAWHACFSGELAVLTEPKTLHATSEAVAVAAAALASAGDGAGEAKAHFVHARALAQLGKIGACEAALDRALAAARRVGDRRRSNAVLAGAPLAALWGPSPVTRASGRCLDVVRVLRITQGAPAVEAVALSCQAVLETLRGRADAARRMIASSRRMVEELGITQRVLEADRFAGLIELLEGDAVAAERWLRPAYEGLAAHGLGIDAAQAAALLGRALLAQGRAAEAEALSQESEALAGDSFKAAIAWRGVRAEALSARGEHAPAVEVASTAVEIAAATDDLLDHADARMALAVALRAAGRRAEADGEEARAIELWDAKGATLLAERARRELGREPGRPREERVERVGPLRRRVRPNAATAASDRLHAAVASRDVDALLAVFAEGAKAIHHPTGVEYEQRETRRAWEVALGAQGLRFESEPLATLGNSLALFRASVSYDEVADKTRSFGAGVTDEIILGETDARGLTVQTEHFAPDRLGDALLRLYERHAELLPDGPERARARATARSIAVLPPVLGGFDVERYAAAFAPDIEHIDHRTVVGVGAVHGAEAVRRAIETLVALTTSLTVRIGDILGSSPDALLARHADFGTDRAGGGAFERRFVMLWAFDAEGRIAHLEQFDADREAEALARFNELTTAPPPARFANTAVRAQSALQSRWREGRLADVIASIAPEFVLDDRRSLTGLRLSGDDFVTNLRVLADVQSSEWRNEPLATRGEQLTLLRVRFSGVSDTGAEFLEEHLSVFECDAGGRWLAVVVFDLGARDAAYAELDERYAAGEGAGDRRAALVRAFGRAFAARDWDGLIALLAPGLVVHDHRLLGWETLHGPAAYVAALRSLVELAPDAKLRIDHVELSPRALLCVASWVGTREGGPFEAPSVFVTELDAQGQIQRLDQYDPGQLDAAHARLAELSMAEDAPRFENAAARARRQIDAAWNARDWERFAALYGPAFRLLDRRKFVQLELDRDEHLARMRAFFAMDSWQRSTEVLATRGDRLALIRVRGQGADRSAGPSEIDFVAVAAVDAEGKQSAMVMFDADDVEAAWAELDERYTAGEGAACAAAWSETRTWLEAFARRDWPAMASKIPPSVEVHDHRTLGWGVVSGAEHIELMRSLAELAPDVCHRVEYFIGREHGSLSVRTMRGTRDGGPFEMARIVVRELDASGNVRRIDHYELDHLDDALARLDTMRPDPLRIPPNAATRTDERIGAALAAGDLEAVAALCAPELDFDDRRRLNLLRGDRELFLAANRLMAGNRATRTVLATMGERLALSRVVWLGRDDMPFEVEVLDVIEVDGEGRLVALIAFDPDERRAASAEMTERYHRGEGARPQSPAFLEFIRAMNAHDAVAARAALPDEFAFSDHRRTGLGRLGNADDYVASLSALWAQSDDAILETLYYVAVEEHASLSVARWFGTLAGGGEFDSVFIRLGLFQGGRFAAAETFELEDLDLARARFEALRPDPLHIPPNAATRTMDRFGACAEAGDWSALDALCAPECRVDDRRRGTLVSGDRNMFLASARMIASAGSRPSRTLLATSGDQLALEHVLWRNPELGTEIEVLELTEVDREGRIVAALGFDADDQRAASRELFERYLRTDASSWMPTGQRELARALRDRDLVRARAALPDAFFFHDHRRMGPGRIETPDGYIAWLRSLFEQSPDGVVTNVCYLATESWGEIGIGRTFGTLADGGAFESPYVRISVQRGGEFAGVELFELEDLERARTRFEELRPDPLRIPPNAATRFDGRLMALVEAKDWDGPGALVAEGATFEDRRRGVLLSGERELLLTNLRFLGSRGVRTTPTPLATAGDRLALQRFRFIGADGASPFEVETLQVTEVDAEGRLLAAIVFDADDRRAASREMFERYARSDDSRPMPPAAFAAIRAMNDHDLDRLRALLPRDYFLDDHRRIGLGRIEGSEAFILSVAALFGQASDLTFETLYTVAKEGHATLDMVRLFGTLAAGSGEFESFYARLGLYQGDRFFGIELFEPDDLELARARFEALRPDPLRIPPNAATRAAERTGGFLREGNWLGLRAFTTPDFHFDDRRKLALVSGGVDLYVENLQVVHTYPGLATRREVLCTAGDRVSLSRLSYTGGPEGSPFEGEFLLLLEVDADGKLRAAIHFDPDDRAAAFGEAHRRFAAGEAGVAGLDPVTELGIAFGRHAWDDLRSLLAEDAAICDHRRLGFETFDREGWLASLAVFAELAPDVRSEPFRILAWNRRGRASLTRVLGTTRDGAEFENLLVSVFLAPGDRIQRFEMFDITDVERALARFEEVTAG